MSVTTRIVRRLRAALFCAIVACGVLAANCRSSMAQSDSLDVLIRVSNSLFFTPSGADDVYAVGRVLGRDPARGLIFLRIARNEEDCLRFIPDVLEVVRMPSGSLTIGMARQMMRINLLQDGSCLAYGLGGRGTSVLLVDQTRPSEDILGSSPSFVVDSDRMADLGSHATSTAGVLAGLGRTNWGFEMDGGVAPDAQLVVGACGRLSEALNRIEPALRRYAAFVVSNSFSITPGANEGERTRFLPYQYYGAYHNSCSRIDALVRDSNVTVFQSPGNYDRHNAYDSVPIVPDWGPPPYARIAPLGVAKNVVTVGAVRADDIVADFSPFGPTTRGRLKPDIVAYGGNTFVPMVDGQGVTFGVASGTSLAVPFAAGVALLMKQRFEQLGTESLFLPEVVKAIMLNSAADIGRPGPDFETGFGRLDGLGCVDIIDHRSVALDSVGLHDTTWRAIEVLGNVPLRLTMAYSDPSPDSVYDPSSTPQVERHRLDPPLVNDLDLELYSPSGRVIHPLILDPKNPGAVAREGCDSLNNVEQCVVARPEPGLWRVRVIGRRVGGLRQRYALAWSGADVPSFALHIRDSDRPLDLGTWADSLDPDRRRWLSPDIWVRNAVDYSGQFQHQHENPVYRVGHTNAYVYVRIWNHGRTERAGWLHVFVAKASLGMRWPEDWVRSDCAMKFWGIGAWATEITDEPRRVLVPADDSVQVVVPWAIPNPEAFEGCGLHNGGYMFMAVIDSLPSPTSIPDRIFSTDAAARVWPAVAYRSSVVLDQAKAGILWTTVNVQNPYDGDATLKVMLPSPVDTADVAAFDSVVQDVVLSDGLLRSWELGDSVGYGVRRIGRNVLRVTKPGAWIGNLHFSGRERHAMGLRYMSRTSIAPNAELRCRLDLRQFVVGPVREEMTGAMRIDVRLTSRQRYPGDFDTISAGGGRVWGDRLTADVDGEHNRLVEGSSAVRTLSCTPNPFSSSAGVTIELARHASMRLSVVDLLGGEVATLADGPTPRGPHRFDIDAKGWPAGVYMVVAVVDGERRALPVLLAR